MRPEHASRVVGAWVRLYTQDLPRPVAARRSEEIAADVHDHITSERARGTSEGRIGFSILSRMARGFIADLSWHWHIRSLKGDLVKPIIGVVVAVAVGLLGIAAIVFGEADDAPGLVLLGLFIVGGALAFGLSPALRTRSRIIGFIVGAIAMTAIIGGVAGWLENNF